MPLLHLIDERELAARLIEDQAATRLKLFKLRAVLTLIGTPHGGKAKAVRQIVAALKEAGVGASPRTLYFWRRNYLIHGFAGLSKRRRSDAGRFRKGGAEVFDHLVEAVGRIRKYGDLTREFRRRQWPFGFERFRLLVRQIEKQILVMPARRKHGILV